MLPLLASCQSGVWKSASPKGLGFGGTTWNAVAKYPGVGYTNSYSYPIAVGVTCFGSSHGDLSLYVNGLWVNTVPYVGGVNGYTGISGIIPPGSSYSVSGMGAEYGCQWNELY